MSIYVVNIGQYWANLVFSQAHSNTHPHPHRSIHQTQMHQVAGQCKSNYDRLIATSCLNISITSGQSIKPDTYQ
jgi:hypothetical protein